MLSLTGKKVLIVDDVDVLRAILKTRLLKEGASVDAAGDGAKAITMIQNGYYDFVLMDVVMPNMDGFITARKIRMLGYTDIPIIAISTLDDEETEQKIKDAGMDGHLAKPIKMHKLYEQLEKIEIRPNKQKPWLKLMYITNRPEVALIAQKYGVDRIWIDLETLGKEERQPGNTVKSHHTIDDIKKIKPILTTSELLVRINPWNEGSPEEIEKVIEAGADMIMLPMWKSVLEVKRFLEAVAGRVKTTLLLETKEAVNCVDEVLKLKPDEIHIGLNDLHLSFRKTFMFEMLADGTVETLCQKCKAAGIPYGFGGIARLGKGDLKSETVIMEHKRLGSTRAILSRSFCDANTCKDVSEIELIFADSMKELYAFEEVCNSCTPEMFEQNRETVRFSVYEIVRKIKEKENAK